MDTKTLASLITLRRDLHRHPETRFREKRTSTVLRERLTELGLDVLAPIAGTGLLASRGPAAGARGGKHVVLRADMDALPTTDMKTVDYVSTTDGVAHACGHDVHCVVALGAAQLLLQRAAVPDNCRLSVLYQPAEEIPFGESSGAQAMLDAGVFSDAPPDAVLAVHCWPQLPTGSIGLDVETAMAAKLAFKITVTGKGAHAATPQLGRDALLGASQIVIALHTLLSREVDPGERVALHVGTVSSGTSQSIVSSVAELSGTVRTVDDAVATRIKESIDRVAGGIASAYGLTSSVEWKNEMPRVHNNDKLVDLARQALGSHDSVDQVVMIDAPPMTTDDFALYAQRWPGLYMKLGVAEPASASWPSLHDGLFDVDESCIAVGAEALARVATEIFQEALEKAETDDELDGRRSLSGASR